MRLDVSAYTPGARAATSMEAPATRYLRCHNTGEALTPPRRSPHSPPRLCESSKGCELPRCTCDSQARYVQVSATTLGDLNSVRNIGKMQETCPRLAKIPPSECERVSFVIQSNSLTKRYGKVLAVDDLSFKIEAGTITGFLGPNGAGKTTTLRMLLGLATPTSGDATIFDVPYERPGRARARASAPCSKRRTFIRGDRAAIIFER